MKKFLLTICACVTMNMVMAQNMQEARLYVPAFDAEYMEGVFGSIYGVSANGEYAVGYDDFVGSCAFMWTRSTGEFEMIDLASMMMDVANDGTAVGNYFVEIPASEDGSFASRPGYYKNGEWKPLPIYRSEVLLTPATGESDDMNGCAMAISADAQFIAGYITDANVYKLFPVLWKWNEELQDYEIAEEYVNIQENIDALDCPYGWVVKDMSDDGTVLSGYSEWGSGARSAAVLINGEEVRLTTLIDPLEKDPDGVMGIRADTEGDAFVSDNGEYVAGFFSEDMGIYNSFTWAPGQESPVYENSSRIYRTVDNDGTIYGSTTIGGDASMYKDGQEILLRNAYAWETPAGAYLSTIFAHSTGAEVLGGIAYVSFSMGAIHIPAVLDTNPSAAVNAVEKKANDVVMASGWAFINGEYDSAMVYNMQGVLVATAHSGNIDMNYLPAGVYVVVVDGVSYKVVK